MVRKILLYSSIGQAGFAAVMMATGLIFPAVLIIINNVVAKFIMFSVTGGMRDAYGTDDYTKLKGVFYRNKLTGIAFTVAALSLVGLPLFFGFYAKLNALAALFTGGNWFLPAFILLLAVIEGAYFIRLAIALWAPGAEGVTASAEHAAGDKRIFGITGTIVVLVLSMILLAGGLLPDTAGKTISSGDDMLGSGPAVSISQLKGGE